MPALRIAIANQKGGTGKTTLALNLAAGLDRRGSTLVLDADPQGSISQWAGIDGTGDLPEVRRMSDGDLRELADWRMTGHRHIVVDCPPTVDTNRVGRVLAAVDMVLIPIQPSPVDLWASLAIADSVREARTLHPGLRAFVVLNQLDVRNALSRSMHESLAELEFPTLQAAVSRRAAYRNAALEGTSVYRLGARGKAAVQEIEAIIEEISKS